MKQTIREKLGWMHWRLRSLIGRHTITTEDASATFAVQVPTDYWHYTGTEREEELSALLARLNPGDTFLDIGANIGVFSTMAAVYGAEVYAVEPQPSAVKRILEHADMNGVQDLITPIVAVLNHTNGCVGMQVSEIADVAASMGGSDMYVGGLTGEELPVQPDVIKVDVEGAELNVLNGLDLKPVRTVFVEVHLDRGVDRNEVEDVLEASGFRCSVLEEQNCGDQIIILGEDEAG